MSLLEDKQARQDAFRKKCIEDGLTPQEALERASVFPMIPRDQIKILHMPKF